MSKESNSRVYKILKNYIDNRLNCPVCGPGVGCNSRRGSPKRNHGKKPKYKNKR